MKQILLVVIASLLAGCGYFRSDTNDGAEPSPQSKPKIGVEVQGVDGEIADNIKAHLTLSQKSCDIPAAYLKALKKSALAEVAEALAAFGFYEAKYDVTLDSAGDCPVANVAVSDLGRETKFTAVDINIVGDATDDAAFMRVIEAIKLHPGDPLKHAAYQKAKQTISSIAAERGYFDARIIASRLEVDPTAATAKATIKFDSGMRYQIGEVTINQNPALISEELISRYFPTPNNRAYSAETINGLNNALLQSNYFASVDARPELNARSGNTVPLSIDLKPRARHSFSASAGMSTNEGFRGRLNYLNRRLNRAGHRGVLDGRASFIAQSGSMEYLIPRANPRAEWLSLQAGIRRESVDSFDTVETTSSVSETKLRPFGWLETRYLRLSNQAIRYRLAKRQFIFF